MDTVALPLTGNVETHGTVIGAASAYLAIGEDPHDGDATRIRINALAQIEASSIDGTPIPENAEDITIRVRWNASGVIDAIDPSFARAGLRVGGIDYWANPRALDVNGDYAAQSFEDSFATNPATGAAWSTGAARAVVPIWQATAGSAQPGRPRLTQRVVYADFNRRLNEPGSRASESAPGAGVRVESLADVRISASSPGPDVAVSAPVARAAVSSPAAEGG